ncbi:MAG: OB-fold domain-containing protein [Myxococcota bacterium]
MSEKVFRIVPQVTPENEHYWRGGADEELRFLRCEGCAEYIHPPAPICPRCLGRKLAVEAVSGRAELLTYTVNHHPWVPGFDPPYVVAIVEIEEQQGLRLTTNIVNCPIESVEIGMPLRVVFEKLDDDVYLPLFEPALAAGGGEETKK